jgi:hypothetical protein
MDTNASRIADALYPVALALANLGAGVGLYEVGALAFSLVLWLSGGLVLVGIGSAVGSRVTGSSMEPIGDRSWVRL